MADLMEMREQEIRGHGVNAYKQAAKAQAQLTGSRRDRRAIQRANAR